MNTAAGARATYPLGRYASRQGERRGGRRLERSCNSARRGHGHTNTAAAVPDSERDLVKVCDAVRVSRCGGHKQLRRRDNLLRTLISKSMSSYRLGAEFLHHRIASQMMWFVCARKYVRTNRY
jgi:hypothetical protein